MAQEGNGILDHAFFYDSENHDRVYGADSFEHWLKKFFTTGVFSGEMQVTANNDMTVTVAGGYINIGGKVKFFQTGQVLIIETAHATYDRIDNIVVERNDTDRDFTVKVVKGGYSSVPAAPTPKRESGIDQRVLAQVKVVHGAVRILQADITDTRTDTDLCGVVTGTVKEYDFQQFQAQFDSYMELYKQSLENYDKEQKALFEKLYEHIRGQLSEDAAGNLQNQIDEAKALYDPDGDGKVVAAETADNALQLGGNPPTYYAKTDMLTQKYNPGATYKKGRTCIQNDKIWRAKADINTPEAWTEGHWEETSLEQIRAEMESELSAVNANIQPLTSENRINIEVNIETRSLNAPERTGIYYVTGDNIQALPSGFSTYGLLFVMRSPYSFHPTNKNSVYSQLYIDVYNNRATRAFNNGAWTDWKNF